MSDTDKAIKVATKYLRDLANMIENGEIDHIEFTYGLEPEKIPNDKLGILEYVDTGNRQLTIQWKERKKK